MNLGEILQRDLSPDIYCLIHNKMYDLEQQVKKQREVIDKANNHIKNKLQNSSFKDRLYSENYIELQIVLDILKEVSE